MARLDLAVLSPELEGASVVEGLTETPWDGDPEFEAVIHDIAGRPLGVQIVMLSPERELSPSESEFTILLSHVVSDGLPDGSIIVERRAGVRAGRDCFYRMQEFHMTHHEAVRRWADAFAGVARPVVQHRESSQPSLVRGPMVELRAVSRREQRNLDAAIAYLRAAIHAGVIPARADASADASAAALVGAATSRQVDPIVQFCRRVLRAAVAPAWNPEQPTLQAFVACLVHELCTLERPQVLQALLTYDLRFISGTAEQRVALEQVVGVAKQRTPALMCEILARCFALLEQPSPSLSALRLMNALRQRCIDEVFAPSLSAGLAHMREDGMSNAELAAVLDRALESFPPVSGSLTEGAFGQLLDTAAAFDDPQLLARAFSLMTWHHPIEDFLRLLECPGLATDTAREICSHLMSMGELEVLPRALEVFADDAELLSAYFQTLSSPQIPAETLRSVVLGTEGDTQLAVAALILSEDPGENERLGRVELMGDALRVLRERGIAEIAESELSPVELLAAAVYACDVESTVFYAKLFEETAYATGSASRLMLRFSNHHALWTRQVSAFGEAVAALGGLESAFAKSLLAYGAFVFGVVALIPHGVAPRNGVRANLGVLRLRSQAYWELVTSSSTDAGMIHRLLCLPDEPAIRGFLRALNPGLATTFVLIRDLQNAVISGICDAAVRGRLQSVAMDSDHLIDDCDVVLLVLLRSTGLGAMLANLEAEHRLVQGVRELLLDRFGEWQSNSRYRAIAVILAFRCATPSRASTAILSTAFSVSAAAVNAPDCPAWFRAHREEMGRQLEGLLRELGHDAEQIERMLARA